MRIMTHAAIDVKRRMDHLFWLFGFVADKAKRLRFRLIFKYVTIAFGNVTRLALAQVDRSVKKRHLVDLAVTLRGNATGTEFDRGGVSALGNCIPSRQTG